MSDDDIELLDDAETSAPALASQPVWTVLVVDDDREVHAATALALRRVVLLGRPLQLVHLHSADATRQYAASHPEPAAILLDVVMEDPHAGLDLVDHLRTQRGWLQCRIILRTGQPGQAPELEVFERYDINDYRTKAEITRTRLITALSAALRAYEQIRTIAENRRGLALIVQAAPDLLELTAIRHFAEGVLTQIAALVGVAVDGIVCAQRGSPVDADDRRMYVVGAAGNLASQIMQPLDELPDRDICERIGLALERRRHLFAVHYSVLFLASDRCDAAVYISGGGSLAQFDRQLIEVFAVSMAACYANLRRFEDLTQVAYRDPLCRLGNRAQLLLWLQQHLTSPEQPSCLALLDLQRFADLNEGLGESFGNQVLQAVGGRLREALGGNCLLARVAGDVFGILGTPARVHPERLLALFDPAFSLDAQRLPIRITLGLANLQPELGQAEEWLRRAAIALDRAKRQEEPFLYYQTSMDAGTRERLGLIHRLHEDFGQRRLQVWFQPQLASVGGELLAIEALLRWPGDHGFVCSPATFVPLAEHSGLMVDLGYFVLEQSVAALRELLGLPHAPKRVAVNVSLPQFRHADFLRRVERIIAAAGLPMQAVELEITESIAMDEPKVVGRILQELRSLGVRIAIDDFGTGFSSLNRLRQLPIDAIKIDQSFVRDIDQGSGQMFVDTIINLARGLGVETIAEGVETERQHALLRQLGCPVVQGYRFAKPMTLADLRVWLRDYQPA